MTSTSTLYDIRNPLSARRVIHDGLDARNGMITVEAGQTLRGVELAKHVADEFVANHELLPETDLVVTEHDESAASNELTDVKGSSEPSSLEDIDTSNDAGDGDGDGDGDGEEGEGETHSRRGRRGRR